MLMLLTPYLPYLRFQNHRHSFIQFYGIYLITKRPGNAGGGGVGMRPQAG